LIFGFEVWIEPHGVCSGWGLNPTLRVLPVPFDYLANGVFADG
jgi:hypothetical protein